MQQKYKNILIIGGSGFLGSHTADQLSLKGHNVRIFDREKSNWLKSNQEMIIGDYLDLDLLSKSMKDIDAIYHLGGVADIGEASEDRIKTIEMNVIGIAQTLELMLKNKIKRLVYASSLYVYSNKGSFYRASKQSAELIIESYQNKFGINYTLLRYGSIYGTRSQEWNGMRKFVTQILNDGKVDYSGDGNEVRDYINVLDAARLSADLLSDEYLNKAITISGHQSMKVKDLFRIIFEIVGKNENIIFNNGKENNDHYGSTPYRYKPQLAKKIVPSEFVDLGQGILELIDDINKV